jgi:hypothetical protein
VRNTLVLVSLLLLGCSPSWEEKPYEVYWIDGTTTLGYSLGGGAYIGRIDEPKTIESNEKYISVYACPLDSCSYYYIDKINDHKFAEHDEFVYGPYTKLQFSNLSGSLGLPKITTE